MTEYHKIQTVFKRDPDTNHKTLLWGEWSIPEFDYLCDNEWIFTEKVDGTNIRVIWINDTLTFGGRTDRAQIPADLMNALIKLFDGKLAKLDAIGGDVVLYGEGYGPKIQKGGGLYRDTPGFVLFDVKVGGWWLRGEDVEDVGRQLGLDVVPVVGTGTLLDMVGMVSEGRLKSTWGDFSAEGIVARPSTPLLTRDGKRIITKVKQKDFE